MDNKDMAKELYYLSEETVYKIIENFQDNQIVDKSLVYCFTKAFFIHTAQEYIKNRKINSLNFDEIYLEYKENLKLYYKTNNPDIEDELLDQVLNFFDNSFGLIETVELEDIDDSYEFRHYTINVFELLRMILEKKSNSIIIENIFDNYIRSIIADSEKIIDLIKK